MFRMDSCLFAVFTKVKVITDNALVTNSDDWTVAIVTDYSRMKFFLEVTRGIRSLSVLLTSGS